MAEDSLMKRIRRSGMMGKAVKTMQETDDDRERDPRNQPTFTSDIGYAGADSEADKSAEDHRKRLRKLRDEQ